MSTLLRFGSGHNWIVSMLGRSGDDERLLRAIYRVVPSHDIESADERDYSIDAVDGGCTDSLSVG